MCCFAPTFCFAPLIFFSDTVCFVPCFIYILLAVFASFPRSLLVFRFTLGFLSLLATEGSGVLQSLRRFSACFPLVKVTPADEGCPQRLASCVSLESISSIFRAFRTPRYLTAISLLSICRMIEDRSKISVRNSFLKATVPPASFFAIKIWGWNACKSQPQISTALLDPSTLIWQVWPCSVDMSWQTLIKTNLL